MNIPIASQNINFPGYGMFWVANSISSTLLGWNNRRLQAQAHEKNQEFQLEMERARHITDDERMQEEIAFKRRLVALAREQRQDAARRSFNAQMQAIELKHYLQYCWPLDPLLPQTILQEIRNGAGIEKPRLNVILMHAPLLPLRAYGSDANALDADIYKDLEYAIKRNDVPLIGHVDYWKDACQKPDLTGGNASIMNIHFLMSQMPTLVIAPQYREGKMYLSGAVWEPQASRPLIRPLLNFDFNPVEAEKNIEYRQQMIDLLHASTSVIIGAVRDSYMVLTQGGTPTLPLLLNDKNHADMKRFVRENAALKTFVKQENENILAALDEKKMPRLLEVFDKKDIEAIKKQVRSNEL
ncbi:MAG: hypothetical protein IKI05_03470 [Bacteroidaceae bacterium]|nr:hypothetical protein [Bacteroidaceae bacterium]